MPRHPYDEEFDTREMAPEYENGEVRKKKKKKKKRRDGAENGEPAWNREESAKKRNLKQEKSEQFDDESDNDEEEALISDVLTEWAGGSSLHGVVYASDSKTYSIWFRLLWLTGIFAGAGVMIWQVRSLIREFRTYDLSTDSEIVVPESLDFPEVTLCRSNYFSWTKEQETGIVDPMNEEEFKAISPNLEDFILATYFDEWDLAVNETWKYIITDFGPCWQFIPDRKVIRSGTYGGLLVEAWLDQEDFGTYNESYIELAAIEVFVLQKGSGVIDQYPSTRVSPGAQTMINVRQVQYGREEESPWTRCSGKAPEYTQEQCRDSCINHVYAGKCGCRYWNDHDPTRAELRYCGFNTNDADIECYNAFNDTEALEICKRDGLYDCSKPPCQVTVYETSSESAKFSKDALAEYEASYGSETFAENFVEIMINFDRLQFEVVTQSPSMTVATLLGNIGGSMGLFLGISVLSVVEIFGDLIGMRLFPRLCGFRGLYGLGTARRS